MTRHSYRVLAVDVAEQHQGETTYRVTLRQADGAEPTYIHYISQPSAKEAPYAVGGNVDLDPRLVDRA